jgi:hypothetical protein
MAPVPLKLWLCLGWVLLKDVVSECQLEQCSEQDATIAAFEQEGDPGGYIKLLQVRKESLTSKSEDSDFALKSDETTADEVASESEKNEGSESDREGWYGGSTYYHHNPPGPYGGPGHGTTYYHHNPPGPYGGPGHGTTYYHHRGGWLQEGSESAKQASESEKKEDSESDKEGWYGGSTYYHHNPPGPYGGPGHGTTYYHHNPPGPYGGPGHGTTYYHHHGSWLQEGSESAKQASESEKKAESESDKEGWYGGSTYYHHNPPGPYGGPGHGTTYYHHNPPGPYGGPGHGTTYYHHRGGWLQEGSESSKEASESETKEGSESDKEGWYGGSTYYHHNPPGMWGGPGHGSTYYHHNPPGPYGGPGHGTTYYHHHGGYHGGHSTYYHHRGFWLQEGSEPVKQGSASEMEA